MLSYSFNAQALAFLSALAVPALAQNGAYFTMGSPALVLESLDPLLSPGGQSAHVHSVVGGSAFAPTMDFALTQTSKCTTFGVTADKSNYWMPALYFQKNGKFTLVPETSPKHKVYYKYGKGDNTPDLERSEFPQGFRMMAGNSFLRSDDGSFGSAGNQLNWQCHSPAGQTATGFPKGYTSCSSPYVAGLAATMRFPECWNGQDFDKDAPMAHMSYPINQDGMAGCPAGFKKARFPTIMIEYWLDVSQFDGQYGADEVPWVLANGDPTGYGFHMDFVCSLTTFSEEVSTDSVQLNGWEPGVLGQAMKGCNIGNTGDTLDSPQCFAGKVQSEAAKEACTIPAVINQDIGKSGPLNALPGCNPVQPGPGLATKATNCAGGTVSPATSVASSQTSTATSAGHIVQTSTPVSTKTATATAPSAPVSTETGSSNGGSSSGLQPSSVNSTSGIWKAAGCFLDALNPRSLGNQPEWWGQQITSSNCVEYCDSIHAKYAGTENGGQCFCGNELINSANQPGKCTSKCSGDAGEICGGSAHLSIYSLDGSVSMTKRTAHHRHSRHFKGSPLDK
ncbi:MAG: hypothetical protein LQ338_003060 [Usnochroma carphineum]|nr:MAG: hypothetical protein LQ338_003060 [Usnochroma carphineum]